MTADEFTKLYKVVDVSEFLESWKDGLYEQLEINAARATAKRKRLAKTRLNSF